MSTRESSSKRYRWVSLALVMLAAVSLAPEQRVDACGPDFPTNLILHRADALTTMWDGSFVEEAARLVSVSEQDRRLFTQGPEEVVAMAREQALYSDAAAKFHGGDLEGAAKGFEALLRLPANERKRLSVAAAYSLGRARYSLYEDAKSIAAFRQVRALVRAGFVDDAGLAMASLGEEARAAARTDYVPAIRLYAQQAALGDSMGVTSLLQIVRRFDAGDRRALYRDDVATSLLALYLYTRGTNELSPEERTAWKKELARQATSGKRGAAYMAAATYRDGEWAAASVYASRSTAPIATWVKAKLALREGDRAKAEAYLRLVERSELVAGTEPMGEGYEIDMSPRSLVPAELGLLALAGDRFTEAAAWFEKGGRQEESAYVVERAMSMDELQLAVLDTSIARATTPTPPEGVTAGEVCGYWQPELEKDRAYCWSKNLLDVYTRRLLRQHRYDDVLEALGPKPSDNVDEAAASDSEDAHVNVDEQTRSFVAEMKRANATTGIERAEHLFAASRILRRYGMEIAGTEVGPDWRIYDGGYEQQMPCLTSPTRGWDKFAKRDEDGYLDDDGPNCALPTKEDTTYMSALEIARVRASAPQIDQRFSYRYVASKLAEEAAGLVPPRSQAYATTLCWAALYASRDQARVDELYSMYVRNGAAGFSIAADCEEPDFRRARNFEAERAEAHATEAAIAARPREWNWPRVKEAAWRRRGWLAYPIAALVMFLLVRFVFARAAYSPGFARDPSSKRPKSDA